MTVNFKKKTPISPKLKENLEYLSQKLGVGISFDVLLREFTIGRKKVAFAFIDGFINSDLVTLIMQSLMKARHEEVVPNSLDKIYYKLLPYGETSFVDNLEESVAEILAGPMVFFIEGESKAIVVDTREYPVRAPEEPDVEKVTRGSRDGFVETLLFNIALIRRRVRDPGLRTEVMQVGSRSLTDVALLYIEDIVNPYILERVKERLQKINVDGLPMAENSVEEFITESFWNPFPEVRYTERPDVAAVHLLEGHVCIVVDTSPSVIIAPVTLFHHVQHAEEFRHNPIIGLYIRWVRLIGILVSVFLVPLWLIIAEHPGLLGNFLEFIGPREEPAIPLFVQFIFANIGLDLIRMASIHTPSPLATALGLVGGLLIGEIAIEVGIFVPEVLLYIGLVAIGVFATPSWELGLANRLIHVFLLVLTGIFSFYGFIAGLVALLVLLLLTRSFGLPYLWPVYPFHAPSILSIILRKPVPVKGYRPAFLKTKDPDTAPPGEK